MIQRLILIELTKRLGEVPAVALVGPRQCGKTTLARSLGGIYFDLEQPADRLKLDLQWDGLMSGEDLVILDEAQSAPEVFPRLRGAIDGDRGRHGRFLLLGSVSPALMRNVSESLAGRLALLELTPFLEVEVDTELRERLWLCGGYPDGGVLRAGSFPRWQDDYLTLLAQRDLPVWGLPAKPEVTRRLMKMVAALHGQNWNASQVGTSLGLDYKTVNSYLDYLVGAFLVRRLSPYQTNIKKRLVKTPKIYWRDSGLLHALLMVGNNEALFHQPWVGASWEGFVIEQILNTLSARGRSFDAHFFRTSDQHEIDLVLETGGELIAIEVKLTTSPGPSDFERLKMAAGMIGATRQFLVSRVEKSTGDDEAASCNLEGVLARVVSAATKG